MVASDAQTNPCSKTESRHQDWNAGKLSGKKIERGANVSLLSLAAIVYAGAKSCAAKIKPQNRNAPGVQRFRCLVNHLVVHRTTE